MHQRNISETIDPNRTPLTNKELAIVSNKEFLLTKASALDKISNLLSDVGKNIGPLIKSHAQYLPAKVKGSGFKISRGENYKLLPYLVLDFPAIFSKEDIFALRTMFWWGNFFSVTLHLQGEYLEHYGPALINNFDSLKNNGLYMSVGDTPWEYHYRPNNYVPLETLKPEDINSRTFVKISKKLPLAESGRLSAFVLNFWELMLEHLE